MTRSSDPAPPSACTGGLSASCSDLDADALTRVAVRTTDLAARVEAADVPDLGESP